MPAAVLSVHARYLRYLLWQFRFPLALFFSLILAGGWLLYAFYGHRELSYAEACYAVSLMIFLQSSLPFPDEWYLQPLFFLLPLIGLGAIADSVVRLAYLVFARKSNLPEWHCMLASTYRDHFIVLGTGKVGYRIVKGLLSLKEQVVAIERSGESHLADELIDLGVPVIRGDGRQPKTLEQAGVKQARGIILSTSDDLTNLDAALTARDIRPGIKVVLRLFDDTLADKFAGAFSMPAISTARVAAPAFIAAATGRKVYQQFELSGQPVNLVDLTIHPASSLAGRTVGQLQSQMQVNIVMHSGAAGVNINPDHDLLLAVADHLLVIAPPGKLADLEAANQSATNRSGA